MQDGNFKPSDVLEGDDLVPAKPPQRMRWVALALGIVGAWGRNGWGQRRNGGGFQLQ